MNHGTLRPQFVALCSAALGAYAANGSTLNFQLLTWNDANAAAELASAVGRKPSATMRTAGDWLVFTADDAPLAAGNNPAGGWIERRAHLRRAGPSPS